MVLISCLALMACARRVETSVAGTDEEMLDRYTARLEELSVRSHAQSVSCNELCAINQEGCDLARKICDIAARQPERLGGRCASAQEECARFGDACVSCRR